MKPTGCTAGGREMADERADQATQGQRPRARGGTGERSRRRIVVHHRTVDTLGKMLRSGTISPECTMPLRTSRRRSSWPTSIRFASCRSSGSREQAVTRIRTSASFTLGASCTSRCRRWAASPARRAAASGTSSACSGACVSGRFRQGWGGRPVRQEQAQGILVAAWECWQRTSGAVRRSEPPEGCLCGVGRPLPDRRAEIGSGRDVGCGVRGGGCFPRGRWAAASISARCALRGPRRVVWRSCQLLFASRSRLV
jgi:hypothetical protein